MFSDLQLQSVYSTHKNNIEEDFYFPVLNKSVEYDRTITLFSAKSLAHYIKGLEIFSSQGQRIRFLISIELEEQDFKKITKDYKLREEIMEGIFEKLLEKFTVEEELNLSNLAYLISVDTIDIKIAFRKKGIPFDQFGIMRDKTGDIIYFQNSSSKTNTAFHSTYESLDVTCSCLASEFDCSKIKQKIESFNNLWENKVKNIYTCDADSFIYKKIQEFSKVESVFESAFSETNCLILDYVDNFLELNIKVDPLLIWNNKVYKLRLKQYVDIKLSKPNKIIFNKTLSYPTFKKIIDVLKKDSLLRKYSFYVTNRLKEFIKKRELFIRERASAGLAIKHQEAKIKNEFIQYKTILDKEMSRELRSKQAWDSFFMYVMKKAANFSVPGSGKTASVFGVYAYLSYKKIVDRIVVIGPKNSFTSWIDEFSLCFGNKRKLKLFSIQDYNQLDDKKNAILYDSKGKNLLLFNYESLNSILNEVKQLIDEKTLLVFDEVHKVKLPDGIRSSNALEISKNSYRTIVMTGTPIPNTYLDIKNMLGILFHDEYNDYFGFSESQLKRPTEIDIENINNRINPFFCRTTKKQLNVPEANDDSIITTQASQNENRIFNILLSKYNRNKLVLIIRLLQLASNPKMLLKAIDTNGEDFSSVLDVSGEIEDHDFKDFSSELKMLINSIDKTQKFSECIKQVLRISANEESVIVWCIFVDSILQIAKELKLKGLSVGYIYGATESSERELILNQFKEKKIRVLITNPHTLAESISLHHTCHNAIYYEYSYNLVHLLQSKDRIHRLGLPAEQYTQYYYLQNEFITTYNEVYSLDKKIYERLLEKENTMLQAIESNKLEQITTSEEDLKFIFEDLNF